MTICQLAFTGRAVQPISVDAALPGDCRDLSGVVVYRPPDVFQFLEGPGTGLMTAFEQLCRDVRLDEIQCILFRAAERRVFADLTTRTVDAYPTHDMARPIDLWAALNLERPTSVDEAADQVQGAMRWFMGRGPSLVEETSINSSLFETCRTPVRLPVVSRP